MTMYPINEKNTENGGDFPKTLRKGKLPEALQTLEKQMIHEAMLRSGGNQRMASDLLGITERMLGYRLRHYGMKNSL